MHKYMLDLVFLMFSFVILYAFGVLTGQHKMCMKTVSQQSSFHLFRSLTVRADDSRCKLCCRFLAADSFVMLALTQGHLVSRALHAAHDHIRHITAVPIPRFLRWGVRQTDKHANRKQTVGRSGKSHSQTELRRVQCTVLKNRCS